MRIDLSSRVCARRDIRPRCLSSVCIDIYILCTLGVPSAGTRGLLLRAVLCTCMRAREPMRLSPLLRASKVHVFRVSFPAATIISEGIRVNY